MLIVIIAIAAIAALVFICILNSITHNVDSNILTIVISICCLVLVTDIIAFFWKFTLIKSIEIDRLPNNKVIIYLKLTDYKIKIFTAISQYLLKVRGN